MMYSTMTYDEWHNFYKPIKNEIAKYPSGYMTSFETYGEELDFVLSIANDPARGNKFVWTEVDGDDGSYIINGYHHVNRLKYYVCEIPNALPTYQEVVVELYRDCECANEGEGKPDCEECEGNGYINIYPETRKELIEIFGEEYANEQV